MRSDFAAAWLPRRPSTRADAMLPAPRNAIFGMKSNARPARHYGRDSNATRASVGLVFPLAVDRMQQNCRGSPTRGVGHRHFAAQVPHCMPRHGQSHPDTDGVLCAEERLEHLVADFRIDPSSVIGDSNLDELPLVGLLDRARVNRYRPGIRWFIRV